MGWSIKSIICFELNEVPKKVFEYYAANYPRSNFARLKRHADAYETVSQDFGHLSPWITWPSLHRGVSNLEHEISDLGQNIGQLNEDFPPLWELLAKSNVITGMFGSLHSYPMPKNLDNYAFYVPDTFAAGPECFPAKFEVFQKFNLDMVAKSGRNVDSGLALKDARRFLQAAPGLGMRARTVGQLARQVGSERMNPDRLVRRRTSQVQIAFDFYLKELKRSKPQASFFFTNHVASAMHRYWPALFPEDYKELKFDAQWLKSWRNEIPHALHEADHQIGCLCDFVDNNPGYKLLVLSSMGQAAVEGSVQLENQVLITNIKQLMSYLGLARDDWQPHLAMQPRQMVTINNDAAVKKFQRLADIDINGKRIAVKALGNDDYSLHLEIFNQSDLSITDNGKAVEPKAMGIEIVQLQDAAGANAYHVPEGILLGYEGKAKKPISTKEHSAKDWESISALEVAPAILRNFGINPPSYMDSGLLI